MAGAISAWSRNRKARGTADTRGFSRLAVAGFLVLVAISAASRPGGAPTVAIVQVPGSAGGALTSAGERIIRQAVQDDVRIVIVAVTSVATSPAVPASAGSVSSQSWGSLARELGVWIVAPPETTSQRSAVSVVAINGYGDRIESQQKRHSSGTVSSGALRGDVWSPLAVFEEAGTRIGLTWGSDLSVEVPALAARGAQVILVSGSWPAAEWPTATIELRELSRRHAVQLVVAQPAAAGSPNDPSGRYDVDGLYHNGVVADAARWVVIATAAPRRSGPSVLGLPAIPVPANQAASAELVELGRKLFVDKSLSSDGKTSCASCHDPEQGFTSHVPLATGVNGYRTKRNVPTLLNVAFRSALFWDGYASSLENQSKYPLSHPQEMDAPYLDQAAAKLTASETYRESFRAAFGGASPSAERASIALAAFQRTLIAAESRADRYLYAGDSGALTDSERRGLDLFRGKANCTTCHTVGHKYALFSDQAFHDTGVGFERETGSPRDGGLGWLTDSRRLGQFLTPTLRNVSDTAPYMHDGSLATLEDVVNFYAAGGIPHSGLDPGITALDLDQQERIDLVTFLHSLSSEQRFDTEARPVLNSWPREKQIGERTAIAAVRVTPRQLDVLGNRERNARAIGEAVQRGAEVVVLPEYAETGRLDGSSVEMDRLLEIADEQQSRGASTYSQLARRYSVWISIPLLERAPGQVDNVRLAISLFDPTGRRQLSQPKLTTRRERGDGPLTVGGPRELRAVNTPLGWLAPLAGDDLQVGVSRLAELGAQVVLVSASWEKSDAVDWAQLAIELSRRHRLSLAISDLPTDESRTALFATTASEHGEVSGVEAGTRQPIVTIRIARTDAARVVKQPLGLPKIPAPMASPVTQQAVDLGRTLFNDRGLSRASSVSCADCHIPEKGFTDGLRVPQGFAGRLGARNTPTLLNAVYRPFEFWDGHESSLEEQVLHAVQHFAEMDSSAERVLEYVRGVPTYRLAFEQLNGDDEIEFSDIARVIAAFERTLVSGNSPFDRWYYGRDESSLSREAQRGYQLFIGEARCSTCHHIGTQDALFTDNRFHNTGIGYHMRFDYLGYNGNGLGANTTERRVFSGEYLTPTLRNVALTGPYMHDGSLATLEDVVEFYVRGGTPNPTLDSSIKPLSRLLARDKRDLVAFLQSLTSSDPLPTGGRPSGRMARTSPQ